MEKDYKKIFSEIQKESIEFNFSTNEKVKIGVSKFGGVPDLPRDFVWPYCKIINRKKFVLPIINRKNKEENKALSFLCQINLEDAAKFDKENLLPKKGMLYFFYEAATTPWGFDPKDKGSSRVFYYEGDILSLAKIELPSDIDKDCIFPEIKIDFKNTLEVPYIEEYAEYYEDVEYDEYVEARKTNGFEEEVGNRSKLLGYADIIQNSIQTECEAVSRGMYMGDDKAWRALSKKEEEDIMERSKDWILLFQLDTVTDEKDFELMWGDMGRLYFYIRKDDLINRHFENVWTVLQCG